MSFNEEVGKLEYDRLAKEIVAIQKEASQLAQWAVVSIAAICAAMANKDDAKTYLLQLKWLPLAIVLVFAYRVVAQFGRLEDIAQYIKVHYEDKFLKNELGVPGWENHLSGLLAGRSFKTRWSVVLFWILLLIGSIIIICKF